MKTCTKCRQSLPLSDFYKRAASPDGLTARCRSCTAADHAVRYAANPEPRIAYAAAMYMSNAEAKRAYGRDYYRKNRAAAIKRAVAYDSRMRKTDPAHAAKGRSRVAKRRSKRKQATPAWADDRKIQEFYLLAGLLTEESGEPYEVDHIVPLQSGIVCGLHNEFNLQVLPLEKNRAKSNRHWPDMP